MSTYNSPTDLSPLTKARSVDINDFDAAVAAAFELLPDEADINGNRINYGTDDGGSNSYLVTLPAPPVGLVDGMMVRFSPSSTNTGASTLNIGLGAMGVKLRDGSETRPGDIQRGVPIEASYSATTGFWHIDGNPTTAATGVVVAPISDATPLLFNAGDPSKMAQFALNALSTAVTRIYSLPDHDTSLGADLVRSVRVSNTPIAAADKMAQIELNAASSYVQTFGTNLYSGWWAILKNTSTTAPVDLESVATVNATSTTSNSIAAGTTWTVAAGLPITAGDLVVVRRTSAAYAQKIIGTVSSYNAGTGQLIVTVIARSGSGTFTDWTITTRPSTGGIDGFAAFTMYPGEARIVQWNGARLTTTILKKFNYRMNAAEVYLHPPGYDEVEADLQGAGGGGGGGRCSAVGNGQAKGGSGGGGGARPPALKHRLAPLTAVQVLTGAPGAAGASANVSATTGGNGGNGGNTSFGAYATAYGGAGGQGGGTGVNAACGAAGGGSAGPGIAATGLSCVGGKPSGTYFGSDASAADANNISGGGAGSYLGIAGSSENGGAAGGGVNAGGTSLAGGSSIAAGAGGGAGGGIGSPAGGAGGGVGYSSGGGAPGGAANTAGTNSTTDRIGGGGGGGQLVTDSGLPGQPGGNGGPGAGGGGGSTANFPQASGAGGAGGQGFAVLRGV